MFFLIHNDCVCGTSESDDVGLPDGWMVVDGPDLQPNQVYWDGTQVLEKPAQPDPSYTWNSETHTWDAPPAPAPLPEQPQWNEFLESLTPDILQAIAQSPMAVLIISRFARLADGLDSFRGESDRLLSAWNAGVPSLTETQRTDLNLFANSLAIPLNVDESNELVIVEN